MYLKSKEAKKNTQKSKFTVKSTKKNWTEKSKIKWTKKVLKGDSMSKVREKRSTSKSKFF